MTCNTCVTSQGTWKSFCSYIIEMLPKESSICWVSYSWFCFSICIISDSSWYQLFFLTCVWYLLLRNGHRMQSLLLTSSQDEIVVRGSPNVGPPSQESKGSSHWETLELYLVCLFLLFMINFTLFKANMLFF